MTKHKRIEIVKEDKIPHFTIQMRNSLYSAIHNTATLKRCKVYTLMDKLLTIGAKAWSRTQPRKFRIRVKKSRFSLEKKKVRTSVNAKQLPRFTIQMLDNLYTAIQVSATLKQYKVYALINKLLVLGAKEWSKKQKPEYKIRISDPELRMAKKMADEID